MNIQVAKLGVVADGDLLPVPARQEMFEGAHVAATL